MPVLDHSVLDAPSAEGVLWRFMSLSKFIGLISSGGLTFVQLGKVAARDPFEGAWSKVQRELSERIDGDNDFALEVFRQTSSEMDPDEEMDDDKKVKLAKSLYGSERQRILSDFMRREAYISCWYTGVHEPAVMWSAYASENDGVVVRTTAHHLRDAFSDCDKDIYWGLVRYTDYSATDFVVPMGNLFNPIFSKRIEYAQEQELRLCYMSHRNPEGADVGNFPPAIGIKCDLNILIQELRVAPFSGEWVVDALETLTSKFGISAPVRRSSIVGV